MTQIKSYLGEIITYMQFGLQEGIEGSLAQYFGEGFLEYHPQNFRLDFCTTQFLPILFNFFILKNCLEELEESLWYKM